MSASPCDAIDGYLGKWLTEPERAAFAAHLEGCPQCQKAMGEQQAITRLLAMALTSEAPVPAGLRLAGMYAGQSGLRIEFREDSATVECGEAHVAEPYVVQDANAQVSVRIQNGAAPFVLSLQPNGTLVGSGTIDVAGRVVTGSTENALTYASRSARCVIGTLTAKNRN